MDIATHLIETHEPPGWTEDDLRATNTGNLEIMHFLDHYMFPTQVSMHDHSDLDSLDKDNPVIADPENC